MTRSILTAEYIADACGLPLQALPDIFEKHGIYDIDDNGNLVNHLDWNEDVARALAAAAREADRHLPLVGLEQSTFRQPVRIDARAAIQRLAALADIPRPHLW